MHTGFEVWSESILEFPPLGHHEIRQKTNKTPFESWPKKSKAEVKKYFYIYRYFYTLAKGIMILVRSLQRSEEDVSDPVKYIHY